jgi:hypothetical protein
MGDIIREHMLPYDPVSLYSRSKDIRAMLVIRRSRYQFRAVL